MEKIAKVGSQFCQILMAKVCFLIFAKSCHTDNALRTRVSYQLVTHVNIVTNATHFRRFCVTIFSRSNIGRFR